MNDQQPQVMQQQPQMPQPQKNYEKKPSQHMHDTKTTFLLIVTLVFALLSLVSLFFVLKMRKDAVQAPMVDKEVSQMKETEQTQMELKETPPPDDQLNLKEEIYELDKLNLDKIENSYKSDLLN